MVACVPNPVSLDKTCTGCAVAKSNERRSATADLGRETPTAAVRLAACRDPVNPKPQPPSV